MEELDKHMEKLKRSLFESDPQSNQMLESCAMPTNVGAKRKQLEMLKNIEVQKALQGIPPESKPKPTASELRFKSL